MKLDETHKNKYNIVLGGSTIAGKTAYFNSYFTKQFSQSMLSTIGCDKRLIKKIKTTEINLWDTAHWGGRFDGIVDTCIKNADGIILMFDLSSERDFYNLPQFLNMITEYHELENFPVLLIGNKSDLDIKVDEKEIEKFLDKENFIGYFEVSCKNYKGVEESVDFMVNYIYKNKRKKFI